jgi:hypothetical protein
MARKKRHKPSPGLVAALERLTQPQLHALHRIAKDPNKGVRVFFTNAHNMITLRNATNAKR